MYYHKNNINTKMEPALPMHLKGNNHESKLIKIKLFQKSVYGGIVYYEMFE